MWPKALGARRNHAAGAICAATALLMYINTYNSQLVFDDRAVVQENNDLRPNSPWTNLLWHDFWGDELHHHKSHKSFRPITSASFKLNFHIHGTKPTGYHIVNIILNSAVAYLFVQLCTTILSSVGQALLAGLLFAVHPIHTEAVAGVVGRAELLASLFLILSFLSYREALHSRKEKRWLVTSMAFCVCSVLSKEQGIMVVPICLCYEFFIVRKIHWRLKLSELLCKPNSARVKLMRRVTAMALFGVCVLVARVLHMKGSPTFSKSDNPGQTLPTPFRQLYYLHLCFVNFWLLLSPSNLRHDWRFGVVPLFDSVTDMRHLQTLGTFFGLAVIGIYGITRSHMQAKRVAFIVSFICFAYLPSANLFFIVGFVVAERVLYIPSMGVCMLVALGVHHISTSKASFVCHVFIKLGVAFVLMFHSMKTLHRNTVWYSGFDLYKDALQLHPSDGLMFSNLAYDLGTRGELTRAEEAHKFAIKIASDYSQPFQNYGSLLMQQKRYAEAELMYHRATVLLGTRVTKHSRSIETYQALGEAIGLQGDSRLAEAVEAMDKAISLQPTNTKSHIMRGTFLMQMNHTREANASFIEAVRLHSNCHEAYYSLGLLHSKVGDNPTAEMYYRKVLAIDGTNGMALVKLGALLAAKNTSESSNLLEAHRHLTSVIHAAPNLTEAQFSLGLVYLRLHKYPESQECLLRAVQLEPTHENALQTLGSLHYMQKNYSKAVEYLSQLTELHEDRYSQVVTALGMSYVHLKMVNQALELYEFVLRRNDKHVPVINALGKLKFQQRQFFEAKDLFSRALKIDSRNEYARNFLTRTNTMLTK